MEFGQSAGIVLKIFPQHHKITLLDQDLGVIEVVSDLSLKVKRLCNGAHIVYVLQRQKNRYFLSAVDFIQVPFDWARHDILFLHHVLELTHYFLPPKSPQADIFHLIRILYASKARSTSLFKRLFLIRFFIFLGMYPEDEELLERMMKIIEEPVDGIGQEIVHLDVKHIDAWLLSCIRLHPYNELFKTSHFLTHQGPYEKI
jgi:hypothetical protein